MAGTTAICCFKEGKLTFALSQKNRDADRFIVDFISALDTSVNIYLDAPLSLPGVYRGIDGCENYFYRAADIEVAAMSPMFLGGLTARAMKLEASLKVQGHTIHESYPGGFARLNDLKAIGYKAEKEKIEVVVSSALDEYDFKLERLPANWHEVDSLLAFLIGCKHQKGITSQVGGTSEGIILY